MALRVGPVASVLWGIVALIVVTLTTGIPLPTWAAEAPAAESAEEEEEVAPSYPVFGQDVYVAPTPERRFRRPIREFFQYVKMRWQDRDPFFRDTVLNAHVRSYYRGIQTTTPGVSQEAWAAGGWLEYKSGWWLDTLQLGGTLFGSGPI